MTTEKSTCAVAPGAAVAAPVCTLDSAKVSIGSVSAATASKLLGPIELFMGAYFLCLSDARFSACSEILRGDCAPTFEPSRNLTRKRQTFDASETRSVIFLCAGSHSPAGR